VNATSILDREFLEMRCRLIDLAASMDRMERGDDSESIRQDPRFQRLREAIELLADKQTGRAERLQLHFSDEYVAEWRQAFAFPR